jgi:hypothetical protein
MEKQMKNRTTTARNVFFKLALSAIIAAGSFTSANAQNSAVTSPTPQIKYIGSLGDKIVFQVDYDNKSQDGFSVEIKDYQGFQFYFDKFKDKAFKKKYAIDKAELGNNSITFTVTTKAGVQQQVFDVNTTSRVVEEVSVVKL